MYFRMRGLFNAIATVKRLSAYSGNKSTMEVVPDFSVEGFFKPIENNDSLIDLSIVGQAYQFECESYNDLRAGDILVIDGVEYGIKGLAQYTMKSLNYWRCICDKPVP